MIDKYIAEYGKRLYGLCVTLCTVNFDADDLYQETWLKVLKKYDSYDSSLPFENWLTKICVNTYRDMLRKKKTVSLFDGFSSSEEKDSAMENVKSEEKTDNSDIREAVEKLPPKLRMTVILFYFSDFSESQTADALKIPLGTVKSRLNKAKKILRDELKEEYDLNSVIPEVFTNSKGEIFNEKNT